MSLKDLFEEKKYKYVSNASLSSLTASGVESPEYVSTFLEDSKRFIPLVDYSKPANFARFGSAEKYYYDSITRIQNTYPYDGSKKEKIQWELSSSGLDLYLFDNGYPRTTGFAVFSTASLTAVDTSTGIWGSYGAAGTGTYEYVSFQGGPHPGEGNNIYIDPDTGEAHYRKNANIYDLSKNRECNLKIGGNDGNTVEFWLKKAAFNTAATKTEVIFDIFTVSSISSSADYGRLTIEMSGHGVGTNTTSPFYVTYMSGTNGISKQNIGSLTTSSIADNDWHHYSFRFKNESSKTSVDLFVDGQFNAKVSAGTTVDYVSGTLNGTIGALATNPSGTAAGAPQATEGWGKLSGSLDEFRFWKVWRTSKEIQTRWFDQVGGGTNTDDANTHLGLYYKFNEGITATASTDRNVLDYSGRISNGVWTGYSTAHSRDTGSAINESGISTYSAVEFTDPILYSYHPDVVSFLADRRQEGKVYDYNNPSTLYYTLPSWIIEEHDANNPDNEGIIANSLCNLTQMISSYFDNTANFLKSMPSLAQNDYFSGSQKPVPFMKDILQSKGFVAPEIFNALDALETFENRDGNTKYTEKINDIKNIIYKNIYNNLSYINKSKGTEKSFRNLIRCFGIDDQIYKLNIYSNNVDYILEDNYRIVSDTFKLINFNTIENSDASVFQYSSSLNTNSNTFISASKVFDTSAQEYSLPFSVETSVIFPNRVGQGDYSTLKSGYSIAENKYPLVLTASIFGMHSAIDTTPADTTWASNDYANFVVKAVKPETFTKRAKFVLTGTLGGFLPELTSSFYDDVYSDSNWSFLVSLYSSKHSNTNEVEGAEGAGYTVEFSGIQRLLDVTLNSFTLTGSITADQAAKFLASPKRVFVGSHKTNFTGSTREFADYKTNNIRVWQNKLTIDDLAVHSADQNNYSIKNPEQNAYLFNTSINNVYVPNKETLLLHWDFTNVTSSDASGEFIVEDLTSGSSDEIQRYGFLSSISNKQFTGLGYDFAASNTNVAVIDDIITAKPKIPESLANENTIKVLQNDDIYFTRDSRPTFFDLYVEKSPYQNISEEMLKFVSTVVDFNNLIGHGVDRYRDEYKALNTLRQLFFERTTAPDVDRYVEYFKWFDLAVSAMIQKLAPMSSGLDERPLRNIIESHILERNKYQSKFPTYEFKQTDPEASLFGINELTYPWKEGHAPISEDESENCLWFKDRSERDEIISSDNTEIDSDRQEVLDVINNLNNATPPNLSGSNGTYQGSTYALRRFARPYKINAANQPNLHGGGNGYENKKVGFWDSIRKRPTQSTPGEGALISIEPPDSNLESFKDCDDNLELNRGKRKFKFSVGVAIDSAENYSDVLKGDLVFPFSLYSSSVDSNPAYADLADFQENLAITNLHHDNYGPFNDVPMQGPFTEKYVGGRPYRHVMTNFTPDNEQPDSEGERLEGWRLTASVEGMLDLVNVDPANAKSVYFREEYAKRPVNIKNIKQLTSSLLDAQDQATDAFGVTKIGNYTNTYEIVMTSGRSINNRYLAESDGELPTETSERDSTFVSGVIDFPLPRRDLTGSNKAIIVNRFSAPGDVHTMTEGMLDIAAAEFSVYNALPYRNLAVRQPLQELLTDHTNQFGLFSDARTVADYERASWKAYPGGSSSIDDPGADLDYIGTGSFHKVNRNTRKQPKYSNEFTGHFGTVSIVSASDNFFVQHQIPQTDVQYAWITASVIANYTGSALYGFEQPDFSNASLASTDLTFVTQSDVGIALHSGLNPPFYEYGPNNFEINVEGRRSGHSFIPTDFAGLNTNIFEPVSSSRNILGLPIGTPLPINQDATTRAYLGGLAYRAVDSFEFDGTTRLLNGILNNRQGPYGGSNWKLYRKDSHPIARVHRAENRLSYLKSLTGKNSAGLEIKLNGAKGTVTSVIEPMITSKYKQLTHRVIDSVTNEEVDIDHSYMNNIRFFTDHSLDGINLDNELLDPTRNKKLDQQMLDVINYYLYQASDFADAPELNPISGLVSFTSRETIFPREQNTYLSTHRQRQDYMNAFWRDDSDIRRENIRSIEFNDNPYDLYDSTFQGAYAGLRQFAVSSSFVGAETVIDYTDPARPDVTTAQAFTASIWPLDAREDFASASPGRIASGSAEGFNERSSGFFHPIVSASDGSGILQNSMYPYSSYARVSASNLEHDYAPWMSFALPQYNRRIAGVVLTDGEHEYKFGDVKWEAGKQSGKAPFYDTYSDYIDEIKRVGKNYSIIPEFRISNHMDFYLNEAENGFLTPPEGAFEITGASIPSNADSRFAKTFSHSDFLKTFSIVNDFYGKQTAPSKVTLSAEALIKFLPYDGFYPADRTVELARLFYDSFSGSFTIDGELHLYDVTKTPAGFDSVVKIGEPLPPHQSGFVNPVWKSLFAPGILFNSIKSGIAVDYPVHTGSVVTTGRPNQRLHNNQYLADIPRISASLGQPGFGKRIPFDALLTPEKYFNTFIYDQEPHPSASINVSASLSTAGKLNYTLAMNNFLASTIDFFKPGGNLTTIVSAPDDGTSGFGQDFDPNKEYRMRVVCYNGTFATLDSFIEYIAANVNGSIVRSSTSYEINPPSVIMYAATGAVNSKTSDYYGSAFGPPVANNSGLGALFPGGPEGTYPSYGSASYEPFTPPYYDGYSHIEYVFRPLDADIPDYQSLNIPDILSNIQENGFDGGTNQGNYKRFCTGLENGGANWDAPNNEGINSLNRMQLTASVDLKLVKQASVEFDPNGNPIVVKKDDSVSSVLAIQPKWETPILNFKDVEVTLPDIGSGSVARGMWHQYGRRPTNEEGIFLQVQDLAPSEMNDITKTGSLADLLGLDTTPRKLGTVAESKKISEAIVAIPFYVDGNGNTRRFNLNKNSVDVAEQIADKKQAGIELNLNTEQPDIAIVDMVSKMKKFVIPPHFDFITNKKSVDPFAMFIFDFEVTLTEKDLTDIWQNLSPNIATNFEKANATLPVDIFLPQQLAPTANGVVGAKYALMEVFPENTRWEVFKVKQRSAYNYFAKTVDSSDDSNFKFQFNFGDDLSSKTGIPPYSYNWPFDFFSLIELAKVDAAIETTPPQDLTELVVINEVDELGIIDQSLSGKAAEETKLTDNQKNEIKQASNPTSPFPGPPPVIPPPLPAALGSDDPGVGFGAQGGATNLQGATTPTSTTNTQASNVAGPQSAPTIPGTSGPLPGASGPGFSGGSNY